MTGCSRATRDGKPLVWDRARSAAGCRRSAGITPALDRRAPPADGRARRARVPADGRALSRSPSYSPDAVAERCGIPAETIRRIAAELAARRLRAGDRARHAAGRDWAGRAPRKDDRPARSRCMPCAASPPIPTAFTPAAPSICCRSCSAPSMCRAAFATSRPIPKAGAARPRSPPASRAGRAEHAAAPVRRSASSTAPEDLLVDDDGTPQRIDKAYSWEAPFAAHGLMHTVIANAGARRSLSDRHAVPLHGEHGAGTRR